MILLAMICFLISICKNKEHIKGTYQSNGFLNIGDPNHSKAYKIGGQTHTSKKKTSFRSTNKKVLRDEIICSACGISLMLGNQFA